MELRHYALGGILCLFSWSIGAQTMIAGGNVAGAWTKEGSPYIIEGRVTVSENLFLYVSPGVEIRFREGASLQVGSRSSLIAEGKTGEPIIFTSARNNPMPGDWQGINLDGTGDRSRIKNCIVEYAEIGIQCVGYAFGCGSFHNFSEIENCILRWNSESGLYCYGYGSGFLGCTPSFVGNSSPLIKNNLIYENREGIRLLAREGYFAGGHVAARVENNVIFNNTAVGISCQGNDTVVPKIINNTIYNNGDFGISFETNFSPDYFEIYNNIIVGHKFGIFSSEGLRPVGGYNDLWNNSVADYLNIDGYDTDIFVDPQFRNSSEKIFQLQCSSPCIDNGNPALEPDPDETAGDIGAFWFDQTFEADFVYEILDESKCVNPLPVQFTSKIRISDDLKLDDFIWDFGDGQTSGEENPKHLYNRKGYFSVSLSISDHSCNKQSQVRFDSIIYGINTPPIANNLSPIWAGEEDEVFQVHFDSIFEDADSDVLEFSIPTPENFYVATDESWVTLTPGSDWFGQERITFIARDENGCEAIYEPQIILDPVNDPPSIYHFVPVEYKLDLVQMTSQQFSILVADPDNVDNELIYNWYVNGEEVSMGSNQFTYTFSEGGLFKVKVFVSDGELSSSFSWEVSVSSVVDNRFVDFKEIGMHIFPNPFFRDVLIRLTISQKSRLVLGIYDAQGKLVKTLFTGELAGGEHIFSWDGVEAAAGVYWVRVLHGDETINTYLIKSN